MKQNNVYDGVSFNSEIPLLIFIIISIKGWKFCYQGGTVEGDNDKVLVCKTTIVGGI
jgi:hypothetical protein